MGVRTFQLVVFALAVAGVLIAALQQPSWGDLVLILLALVGVSCLGAFLSICVSYARVAFSRARNYGRLRSRTEHLDALVSKTTTYLGGLTTTLRIEAIKSNERGTVWLVVAHPPGIRLAIGTVIEVIRRSGGEVLGRVGVVQDSEDFAYGEPIDRSAPEFWEGLEDRMLTDFSAPNDVEGRLVLVSSAVALTLLGFLRETAS